jgi:hypothetical protein
VREGREAVMGVSAVRFAGEISGAMPGTDGRSVDSIEFVSENRARKAVDSRGCVGFIIEHIMNK